MEKENTPKVHRHRHRRSESRQRRQERQQANCSSTVLEQLPLEAHSSSIVSPRRERRSAGQDIIAAEEGFSARSPASTAMSTTRLVEQHERQNSSDSMEAVPGTTRSQSQSSQQTVLLVNGHEPPPESVEAYEAPSVKSEEPEQLAKDADPAVPESEIQAENQVASLESPTQQQNGASASNGGNASSRNSSGDALSLRETLQQLPPTVASHRHRRTRSPQSPTNRRTHETDTSFQRGILGFMDRELKQSSPTPSALSVGGSSAGGGTSRKLQSLSDPQASPAQRSIRSRSSLEKSPRRKRSKSESRRRRERKLIAAGEMEVRQANETLMRYLKQCSEMNDASLSGELEIDKNFDERRVHRKTKSQRDKRGHLINKLYTAGGLSSILRELSDDIVPAEGEEIYNPFTPVVSPTDDTPAHIDKMFLQTSSGYRPVEHSYYKHSFGSGRGAGDERGAHHSAVGGDGGGGRIRHHGLGGAGANGLRMRSSGSYGDTRCLLDGEDRSAEITTKIQLACIVQRIWLLISNICHGLLAGLALAHLLFVLSSHPMDWSKLLNRISLAGETVQKDDPEVGETAGTEAPLTSQQAMAIIGDYATFAEIYLNTFYCLAIVCLVSVLDRMDICRWDLSNATELISFRWVIIAMIYIGTIILTICSNSIDEQLYFSNNVNVTLTQGEMLSNSVMNIWSSLSLTRSIGAICGWIMIGLTPHEDLLYEHLLDLTKYQLTNS